MEPVDQNLTCDEFMDQSITPLDELKATGSSTRSIFEVFILSVQKRFCVALETIEKKSNESTVDNEQNGYSGRCFVADRWQRKEGGGGISCVLQDGKVFEKAGVNVSVVTGQLSKEAVVQMKKQHKDIDLEEGRELPFFAAGISSVIHPRNPHVPTIHFNYRYFEIQGQKGSTEWWFGGGTDLTPYVYDENSFKHFHSTLADACDRHDKSYYPKFKAECDDYFYIKHRGERRGVGGIFFDDLNKPSLADCFGFIKSCAQAVIPCYLPLVEANYLKSYSPDQRRWQLLRRGRYVEFNLVYDRGTKFGFATPGARIESILISLPLHASWEYMHSPVEGSDQDKLMKILKQPKDWVC